VKRLLGEIKFALMLLFSISFVIVGSFLKAMRYPMITTSITIGICLIISEVKEIPVSGAVSMRTWLIG